MRKYLKKNFYPIDTFIKCDIICLINFINNKFRDNKFRGIICLKIKNYQKIIYI